MIAPASKYAALPGPAIGCAAPDSSTPARAGSLSPARAGFHIVSKRAREMTPADFRDWMAKATAPGGELHEYVRIEKARTTERYRAVAKKMEGFQQNNKSELRRVAEIPLRDYFRWTAEDPDFFADNKNLKSLKRDNPDVKVYL
jgi:hypothetical protein